MDVIGNGMKMSEEYVWDLWDFIEILMSDFVVVLSTGIQTQ